MNKYTEGILSDIFDLFTQTPEFPAKTGTQQLEKYLDPYDMDDLWEGVLYKLRQVNDERIKNVMKVFFPENGRPDLSNIQDIPENLDPQLLKLFRYQFENVVIEFVTTDALDIINEVQRFVKNKDSNYDISQITGKQYFGSILKQVTSNKYDIINKLKTTWTKFKNEAKKDKWQNKDGKSADYSYQDNYKSNGDLDKSFNDFAKKVKRDYPELSNDDILDNLRFLLKNDNYLIKAVGGMKHGGER